MGEQSNSHVLRRCHRLVERQAALLVAGDAVGDPSPEAIAAMEEVGVQTPNLEPRIIKLETLNPKSLTLTLNPKPYTQTQNPKP